MARTPLFRFLRRALALARAADAGRVSAAEAVELDRTGRLSRRELLAGTAVTAAGLALGCRPGGRSPGFPLGGPGGGASGGAAGGGTVAVVGAGLAGLVCAHRLVQAGVAVRVYEAQRRTGGRMWSLRGRFPDGQVCELGGELIDTTHQSLRALCAELGLELDDFDRDDPRLADQVWFFDGRRIGAEEVVEAFRPLAARMDLALAAVPGGAVGHRLPADPAQRAAAEAIDRQSIAEWLDEAGAEGWFRTLLEVAYVTEYGLETDRQSAWNLLMLIDTAPDPFRIFGDSDERFHVRGGNDLVPAALAEALGERIETGLRLEALGTAADGRYRLSLAPAAGDGGARQVTAERVVLALPFSLLREVRLDLPLPAVKRRAIERLGYGTNAKLMVRFDERPWRAPGGSNGSVLTDLPFQLTWESTRLQPGRGGILVAYGGGRHGVEMGEGTAAEQAERFAAHLDRVFPGAAALRTGQVRFHWPSFRWTRGSYACYLPGQWTGISGAEAERVGNLHFAGEHTSVDFQGFMEGACESGERAAGEVLADLGLPWPVEREVAAAALA
jgi:monoamine oxidase